ncbi:guanylate kinase [Sulfurospirillum arcachonense]|uniref:guanylate kinase n=1 Tax=Sulfurospirillum arcachonense TaxID=57666 RepID=UPI000468D067|nr:guanylate kinase [Sulfurospirillum arcachonense]
MKGSMLIISGPSGSGKSSLMNEMFKKIEDIYFSISTTTRDIRDGEVDGVNYHYISKEEFEQDIEEGLFLEWAKVHDNYYGTSLKPMLQALHNGKLVVLDIDVQGHKIAREKFGNSITSIFLTTANQKILKYRLSNRGTDTDEVIEKRINNAVSEMTRIKEYDYILVNDNFDETLKKLTAIAVSSRCKVSAIDTEDFISSWVY